MKGKITLKNGLIACLCSILFVSCFNDVDLTKVSKDVSLMDKMVIPIGNTSITMEDIIKKFDSELIGLSGDSILLRFSDSVKVEYKDLDLMPETRNFSQTFKLRDYAVDDLARELGMTVDEVNEKLDEFFGTSITVDPNVLINNITVKDTIDLGFNKDVNDTRIDSIKLSTFIHEFTLNITDITGLNPEDITLTLKFDPRFAKLPNNQAPTFTYTISAWNEVQTMDLSNLFLIINNQEKGIPYEAFLTINSGSDGINITKNAEFKLDHNIKALDFEVIYGKFKPTQNFTNSVITDIDIPEEFTKNGWLRIANPEINLTVTNQVGVALQFQIDYIKAYKEGDEGNAIAARFYNTVTGQYDDFKKETLTARPNRYGDAAQIQKFGPYDKDNGGTYLFFDKEGFSPNKLAYSFSVTNSVDSDYPDFIAKNSMIKMEMNAKVPFQLNVGSYFAFSDTLKDVSKSVTFDNSISPDSLALHLEIINGLPVTARLGLELYDSNGVKVQSTLNNPNYLTIYAAKVDNTGKVIESNKQTNIVRLTKQQYEDLKKTQDLHLKFRVDGQGEDGTQRPMFLSPNNKLTVAMGLDISGVTLNLDSINSSSK